MMVVLSELLVAEAAQIAGGRRRSSASGSVTVIGFIVAVLAGADD